MAKIPLVALGLCCAALMLAPKLARAQPERETVLFLVGQDLCQKQLEIAAQYPNYYVVCAREPTLTMARMHYWYFEQKYYVIYVVPEPIDGKNGEAFNDKVTGAKWAHSINWNVCIEHERLHLVEDTFYTSDGMHGTPKSGAIN